MLAPNDTIAVVVFDSSASTLVATQVATNRMRIAAEIARLASGGGSNTTSGLALAFETMKGIKATQKHVIVFGLGTGRNLVDLAKEMRATGITISAVAMKDADRNALAAVVEAGNGRLFVTDDIGQLPKLFFRPD
jgi:hypothetical protein